MWSASLFLAPILTTIWTLHSESFVIEPRADSTARIIFDKSPNHNLEAIYDPRNPAGLKGFFFSGRPPNNLQVASQLSTTQAPFITILPSHSTAVY